VKLYLTWQFNFFMAYYDSIKVESVEGNNCTNNSENKQRGPSRKGAV
jgi:hypothetical protein